MSIPTSSADAASVVVRSDVSMTPSQTGDFTRASYLQLDTGVLQCVCGRTGVVRPVVSSSSSVCSTVGLRSTGTGGSATVEQCNDSQMGTCTAADNYDAGATLDEVKWSDCVFDADYQLNF